MRGLYRLGSAGALAVTAATGLVVSGYVLSAQPVLAKGKASYSKEFTAAAKPVQDKVKELEKLRDGGDAAGAKAGANAALPMLDAAMAAVSTDLDKLAAGQFAFSLGGMNDDPSLRQKGIQMMLDSGQIAEDKQGQYLFYLGNFAYAAKDYPTAMSALAKAASMGFEHEALVPLMVQAYQGAGQAEAGLAAARKAIEDRRAAGLAVPQDWIERSNVVAYNAKSADNAVYFSTVLVDEYPGNFNWLAAAQIIRALGGLDPQTTLDLFRLMDRAGALDNEPDYVKNEYKEYIETADPRRLPGEVVRIIDKGVNSGAIDLSGWVAEARTNASGRIASDKASLPSEVAGAMSAATGTRPLGLADAFLNYGNAAQAEELYSAALAKGGIDANTALTRLGIAQFDQGKLAEAKANFAKVTGPRAIVSKLWMVHIDNKLAPAPAAPAQ
ncbi:MAG: hypothetical protein AB7G24_11915 [Novosphingobium sp.]